MCVYVFRCVCFCDCVVMCVNIFDYVSLLVSECVSAVVCVLSLFVYVVICICFYVCMSLCFVYS